VEKWDAICGSLPRLAGENERVSRLNAKFALLAQPYARNIASPDVAEVRAICAPLHDIPAAANNDHLNDARAVPITAAMGALSSVSERQWSEVCSAKMSRDSILETARAYLPIGVRRHI
jgi:hypothetical protein